MSYTPVTHFAPIKYVQDMCNIAKEKSHSSPSTSILCRCHPLRNPPSTVLEIVTNARMDHKPFFRPNEKTNNRSAGSMAERLTTNQEVPGSTPGWIETISPFFSNYFFIAHFAHFAPLSNHRLVESLHFWTSVKPFRGNSERVEISCSCGKSHGRMGSLQQLWGETIRLLSFSVLTVVIFELNRC